MITQKAHPSSSVDDTTITMPDYTDIVDVDDLMEAMEAEAKRRSLKDLEAPGNETSLNPAPEATARVADLYDSKPYEGDDYPHTQGHHTANPFAPREGKTLLWRDVNMTLVR
jgi:hypothetical protein